MKDNDIDQKFEDARLKIEAYCAATPPYKMSVDENRKTLLVEGGKAAITVTVKDGKLVWSDTTFQEKVFDFQMEETQNGGFLPVPIDESSKKDIQALLGEFDIGTFKGLKIETVRDYLCPKGTTQEFLNFLMEARILGLNPFAKGEFWFVKLDNGRVFHHVGVATFIRRAAESPDFIDYKFGVIVAARNNPDAQFVYREGELYVKSREELVGAWCKVWLKSRGIDDPIYAEVALDEYDTGSPKWKKSPAMMICKVAKSHGLKKAFPKELKGMYLKEELGIDADPSREIQGEATVVG